LPPIGLEDRADPALELAQDVARAVGRAVIDDDDLEIPVGLIERRALAAATISSPASSIVRTSRAVMGQASHFTRDRAEDASFGRRDWIPPPAPQSGRRAVRAVSGRREVKV
jgi:hypothetical protein